MSSWFSNFFCFVLDYVCGKIVSDICLVNEDWPLVGCSQWSQWACTWLNVFTNKCKSPCLTVSSDILLIANLKLQHKQHFIFRMDIFYFTILLICRFFVYVCYLCPLSFFLFMEFFFLFKVICSLFCRLYWHLHRGTKLFACGMYLMEKVQ